MSTRQAKPSRAILLMAYGTPEHPEDIKAYYTDVRRGSVPDDYLLKELTDRYNAIGGTTPLKDITDRQAHLLAKKLNLPVYVGMKHWHPYIKDTVSEMRKDGITHITALVMAPHYSMMSIGDYKNRLTRAIADVAPDMQFQLIDHWGDNRIFIDSLCLRIQETLNTFPNTDPNHTEVIFSAHSLPAKILEAGDPYQTQLRETAALAAKKLHLPHWRLSFQSAGRTRDTWLGPDILQELSAIAATPVKQVLVAPIGFTTDNLEILYDLDIQAMETAHKLGLVFKRIPSANATPRFIDALEDVVTPFLS